MPTYVYECAKCGDELEVWQSFSEDPLKRHSGCGGKLTKVLQPVGIVFKGSGFHKTDSRAGTKRARSDRSSEKDNGSGSGAATKEPAAKGSSDKESSNKDSSNKESSDKGAGSGSATSDAKAAAPAA